MAIGILLLALTCINAVTVTIGSATGNGTGDTANLPIRAQSNYSYSQQIYTRSQINQPNGGMITSIRFYCASSSYSNSQSWTVYLGHTSKTSFTSISDWVAVGSLTQVYSGNVTFGSDSWMTITLTTPFMYNNTANLLVAVDENTSGNAGSARNFRYFTSTNNTGMYIYSSNDINPSSLGNGTRVATINRFSFELDPRLADPTSVTATAPNESQINLAWQRNSSNSDVMIAVNSSNTFGTPANGTEYTVGSTITGGGQVVYNGSGTSFAHSGLNPNTTYYYKVWSKGAFGSETIAYSPGVSVSASTPLTYYLLNQSFANTPFPPTSWTRSNNLWTSVSVSNPSFIGYAAQFRRTASGSANTSLLITPGMSIPSDGYSVSFRINRTTDAGTEQLRVYLNNQANLTNAVSLGTINRRNILSPTVRDGGWYKYTIDFPAGSTGTRYVIFEGYSTTTIAMQIDDVSVSKITSTYPVQKPRFIAEWEPARGAVVAYYNSGFGVPNSMIVDLSNEGTLYVITPSGTASLPSGTNMSNVVYITSSLDSYWVRDFGPWSIFDGDDNIKFIDFEYNRPRYNDNGVNTILANQLGYNLFPMNYVATGGNVMTDGYGKAMSTNLVQGENVLLNQTYIDQMFENYLGVSEYQIYADPLTDSTIDHIDTWGKLLDVDKVMISQVPSGHANYATLEAMATLWATKISSYGTPYRVFRVDCGSSQAPYINSFIYNNKIYVPQMSSTASAQDNAAFAAYRNAMPGYTVKGFYSGSWLSDDALHCRVNTIFDENMIHVYHIPITTAEANSYATIQADISSSLALSSAGTYVSYRFFNLSTSSYTAWNTIPLTHELGKTWVADIPTPGAGFRLEYTIKATNTAGKTVDRSLCGRDDPYKVTLYDYHYRTVRQSGNWNDETLWEVSTDFTSWIPATQAPTSSNSASITIREGHTVTITQSTDADQFIIEAGGELIIAADTQLVIQDGDENDLQIDGRLTITGSLVFAEDASSAAGSSSTIEFNGSGTQETGAGFPAVVKHLIVNNEAGLTITNTVSITGTLTQHAGGITGEPAPDGYYSMDLNHLTFPETGHLIQGWDISMTTPALYPDKVNREWNISGSYEGTKTLTFYWTDVDDHEFDWVGESVAPAVYYGTTQLTPSSFNVSSSPRMLTVEVSSQLTKGLYTIGRADSQTLPVELSSFLLLINPHHQIILQWVTQSETNLVGYRIYRGRSNVFADAVMLNAFIEGTNTSQTQIYVYCDNEIFENGCYYYWLESQDFDGTSCIFGPVLIDFAAPDQGSPAPPIVYGINSCYPNPFNPNTTISFGMPQAGMVKINIFNQRGQLVRMLFDGIKDKGTHKLVWDGKDNSGKNTSSGIYLIRMTSPGKCSTRKVVLMK